MATPSRKRRIGRYGLFAAVLGVVAAAVAFISNLTEDRIAQNQRAWFVARLDGLIAPSMHDNDLYSDRILAVDPDLLGATEPLSIYRARKNLKPVGAIMTAIAPEGYGGPIELLIAIDYQGAVSGVDVLRHNETQGIGDGFTPRRSNWLQSLLGRSLDNTARDRWTIRKDGGDFEQFTGASITPRAILKAVRNSLEYYSRHRDEIFSAPPDTHAGQLEQRSTDSRAAKLH